MFKSRKKNLAAAVALGAALLVFGAYIFFCLFKYSTMPYHSTKVSFTVTRTEKFFDEETVYGVYRDDDGAYINAEIMNLSDSYDGRKANGYVFPDDPYKVYVSSPIGLTVAAALLASIVTLLGIILIIAAILQKRDFDFLRREGIFAAGEVYSVRRETVDKDVWYIFSIVYSDSEGGEHSFDVRYENKKLLIGDKCTVVYAKRKNGKYANEIADI